jgi:hypothetical protein
MLQQHVPTKNHQLYQHKLSAPIRNVAPPQSQRDASTLNVLAHLITKYLKNAVNSTTTETAFSMTHNSSVQYDQAPPYNVAPEPINALVAASTPATQFNDSNTHSDPSTASSQQ